MSDQSQGPGWWLASDGKWYPPDQAPALPPRDTWATPPMGPPPSSGMSTGAIIAIVVVVGLVGLALVSVVALQFLGEEAERSFSSTGTAIESGDDGGSTPVDPAELPAGYVLIEGDGVSIGAPDTWQEIAPEDFAMSPEDLQQAFPDAPKAYVDQATRFFEQGAVLVAFESGDVAPDNISIGAFPGTAPFSEYQQSARREVEALGGQVLDSSTVQLPAGEAARVEYKAQVIGPDGSETGFAGVQFYVAVDGRTYVITVTAGDGAGALADTMAGTFRIE